MPGSNRFIDTVKHFFWWYVIYPVFPYFRDAMIALHIISHSGRQPWHIGWFRSGRTLKEFAGYLGRYGFGNHFIAWTDSGQVLGLRKHDGVGFQYHVRVFRDGEVCGHYEETPEADPVGHFKEKVFEPRVEKFKEWFGDWVQVERPDSLHPLTGERVYLREDEILASGNTSSQSAPAASRGFPENG